MTAIISGVLLALSGKILLDGIQCECNLIWMIMGHLILAFILLLLKEKEKTIGRKMMWLLYYTALGLILFLFRKILWDGFENIVNYSVEAINSYYGVSLRRFIIEEESNKNIVYLFFSFAALLLPQLVFGKNEKIKWWIILECTVLAVVIGLLVGNAPKNVVFLLSMTGLILYRLYLCLPKDGILWQKAVAGTWILAVLIVSVIFGAFGQNWLHNNHNQLLVFQRNLEQSLDIFHLSGITNGSLSNAEPYKSHDSMFQVTLDRMPECKVFFPGFTGEKYANNQWIETNAEDFYQGTRKSDQPALSKMVLSQGYKTIRRSFEDGEIYSDYSRRQEYTIKYTGVKDDYGYFPYFTNYSNERLEEVISYQGDGYAKVGDISEMTVTAYNFYQALNSQSVRYDGKYSQYVYEHYLDVDRELALKLLNMMEEDDVAVMSVGEMAGMIKSILNQTATYATDLSNLSFDEDYVEHFLFEEKKGYCCHFATAATLMFRSLGIPARYVTGYAIGTEEFQETDEGKAVADITDDYAHAWTEIYITGKGWIPVEVTPGGPTGGDDWEVFEEDYENRISEGSGSGEVSENETVSETTEPEEAVTTEEQTTEENTQDLANADENKKVNATQKSAENQGIRRIILCLIGAALLIGLWTILTKMVAQYRYGGRHQKDCSGAVTEIRKQLRKQLRNKGYKIGEKESEREFIFRALTETLKKEKRELETGEMKEMVNQFFEVQEKQAYSEEPLVEGDVQKCNALFDCFFPDAL